MNKSRDENSFETFHFDYFMDEECDNWNDVNFRLFDANVHLKNYERHGRTQCTVFMQKNKK